MFRYITTILLFFISCAYAMELEIVQKRESLFDALPSELHSKIIKNIFSLIIREDGDSGEHRVAINKFWGRVVPTEHIDPKKLDQHVLHIPIPLAIRLMYEFHQLQKLCEQEIGGKKFAARELFVLPREQRDVFVRMANRGFWKQLGEGDLSSEDYNVIQSIKNDNIKKGLDLRLLNGSKITSYARSVGAGGIYLACALVFGDVCIKTNSTYLLNLIIGSGVSGASLLGISILLELCGCGAYLQRKCF